MEIAVNVLENGLRVVHQYMADTDIVHCAIFINAGTRDEKSKHKGIAHFTEHLLFKGTKNRKPFHILNRLEIVGGEINAFTTKEETCIHASFLKKHFERAVELIADLILNSTFPENELEKEKEVIIDEINSCQDNPSEQIYDDFEELLFKGHSLSYPILGTIDNVKKLTRKDILNFIKQEYVAKNMCFSSIGAIESDYVLKICDKYFAKLLPGATTVSRKKLVPNIPFQKTVSKATNQSHIIIGGISYNYNDKKRWGLILLNNLLGGPGMNSRLNMLLREKHGIAYNIFATYIPYSDTGCMSIYIGTDINNKDKAIQLVKKELSNTRSKEMGAVQLKQAKQQLMGQVAMSQENRLGLMQYNGKNLLNYNAVETSEQVYKKIENITAKQVRDIANEIFNEKNLSTLIYAPN